MLLRLKFKIDALVTEILDQLPKEVFESSTTTFFDPAMAGGQFVVQIEKRLRACGHSDENIASRVYGLAEDIIDLNYAINTKKLIGRYAVGGLEEMEQCNMKFDVIVGNPPYQARKGESATIWDVIINMTFDLLQPNGHMAMITPSSWRKPGHALWNKLTQDRQLIWLDINNDIDGMRVFGAGTRFDRYVIKNAHVTATFNTTIIDEMGVRLILPLAFTKYLPNAGISIFNKIMTSNGPKLNAIKTSESHTQRNHISKNSSSHFIFKQLNAISKTGDITSVYSSIPHSKQNDKKVIFSDSRFLIPYYDKLGEYGTTQHGIYIIVSSDREGNNLVDFLKSPLIQFIIKFSKWSNFQIEWKMLLDIDWPFATSESVNTDMIYTHFNLTQEEINYIEEK